MTSLCAAFNLSQDIWRSIKQRIMEQGENIRPIPCNPVWLYANGPPPGGTYADLRDENGEPRDFSGIAVPAYIRCDVMDNFGEMSINEESVETVVEPERRLETSTRVERDVADVDSDESDSEGTEDGFYISPIDAPIYGIPVHEGALRERKDSTYYHYQRRVPVDHLSDRTPPLQFVSMRPEYRGDYRDSVEVRAYYREMLELGFTPGIIAQAFVDDPTRLVTGHYARIEKLAREMAEQRRNE